MIGYLPEVPPLYKEMTVREYLEFAYALKNAQQPRRKHLDDICEQVKLSQVWGRRIGNLSKGYQQRVGLAQALVGDPPVLILDEPTSGLDPQQITEIRALIKRLGERHTVLLSSHILPEIQAVCDRILIISRGSIVADGTTRSLSSGLSASGRLTADIKGDPRQVLPLLSSIPGIERAEKGIQNEPGVYEYSLLLKPKADPRQAVFEALAEQKLPLLGLKRDGMTLEEIFLRLTAQSNETEGELSDIPGQENRNSKEEEQDQ